MTSHPTDYTLRFLFWRSTAATATSISRTIVGLFTSRESGSNAALARSKNYYAALGSETDSSCPGSMRFCSSSVAAMERLDGERVLAERAAWAALETARSAGQRGVKPGNNRQVISGILHVLKFGCRCAIAQRCMALTPPSTIGSIAGRKRVSGRTCSASCAVRQTGSPVDRQHHQQGHRCSAGEKGGPKSGELDAVEADARPKSMPLPTLLGA